MKTMNSQFEPGTNSNPLGRDNPNESEFPLSETEKEQSSTSGNDRHSCSSRFSQRKEESSDLPTQDKKEKSEATKETYDYNPKIVNEEKNKKTNSVTNSLDPDQEKYPILQTEVTEDTATKKELESAVDEINPDINSMDSRG